MNEKLFRHRLAVILGAFGAALLCAWAGEQMSIAALSDVIGLERSFLVTMPVLVLAFLLRVLGESRLGSAVYGQEASARVVTSGVFSLMRHPLYLGTWLFFIAVCAPYVNLIPLTLLSIVFAFALRAIATHEERALADAHGEAWRRYASIVPRVGVVPKGVDPDGVRVTARALANAVLGNLGFAALALYRGVVGTVGAPRGLATLTLALLAIWFSVLIWRRVTTR